MKPPIVADTSGVVSLANTNDTNHAIATAGSISIQEQNLPFIVPGDVITETINVLGKKMNHALAIKVGDNIIRTESYTIIDTSPDIRDAAFEIFKKLPESVSFTDCIVMAIADLYNTKYIFGFDKIFCQMGYIRFGMDDQRS